MCNAVLTAGGTVRVIKWPLYVGDNHELLINVNKTLAMTLSRRSGRGSREIKLF